MKTSLSISRQSIIKEPKMRVQVNRIGDRNQVLKSLMESSVS
jgi:hypothetical protein